MVTALELLVNMWTFGAPAVVVAGAMLRLMAKVPARARYVAAVCFSLAALLLPVLATFDLRAGSGVLAPVADGVTVVEEPIADWTVRIWLVVAFVMLTRDAIGHLRLRRTRRSLVPAHAPWPDDIPLLLSPNAPPHTLGLLRPAVVLPADLATRFDTNVVSSIARHELSHARWRDPLVYALLRAIAIVFWPAPAWLALRWVRREREAAADAYALRDSNAPEPYVEALVRLARPKARELAAAMAASDLEYRARRILAPRRVPLAAILVVAGGTMLLSMTAPAQLQLPESPTLPFVAREVVVEEREPEPAKKRVRAPKRRRAAESPPSVPQVQLPPPRALIDSIDTHVDVDRHAHVAKHVDKDVHDGDDDRRVVRRVVIRN